MSRETFKKIITSEQTSNAICKENRSLITRFLKEKDRKCSDKTIYGYTSDLEMFFSWNYLNNDNKYFPLIKKIEFSDFFNYCVSELKWGSARFGRMRSCLSGLADFIIKYYDEEFPSYRNFIKETIEAMPKVAARKKTILKEEEIDNILKWLLSEDRYQEACLLSLAITCGARISELIQFTTDLIDENNTVFDDVFLETTDEIRTKGFGKEGHRMTKYIIKDEFLPIYKSWLKQREEILLGSKSKTNHIFIKKDGKPAATQTINRWLKSWEEKIGKDIYMHSFRHYFVTHLTRLGLSSDFIIEIMGWKTGDMYKIYNDLSAKDKKWKDTDILKNAIKTFEEDSE